MRFHVIISMDSGSKELLMWSDSIDACAESATKIAERMGGSFLDVEIRYSEIDSDSEGYASY